jgi:hypothetical protein
LAETASGLDITLTYDLDGALALLPLPRRATEILDFTGKRSRERSPQRRLLHPGAHVCDARRAKPGVESPYLLTVGVPGFGLRTGEVRAVHVAWSGDQRCLVEQLPEGAGVHASALGGGELLEATTSPTSSGDHNRELHEVVHSPGDRPAAHAQVEALYRMLDAVHQVAQSQWFAAALEEAAR